MLICKTICQQKLFKNPEIFFQLLLLLKETICKAITMTSVYLSVTGNGCEATGCSIILCSHRNGLEWPWVSISPYWGGPTDCLNMAEVFPLVWGWRRMSSALHHIHWSFIISLGAMAKPFSQTNRQMRTKHTTLLKRQTRQRGVLDNLDIWHHPNCTWNEPLVTGSPRAMKPSYRPAKL